MSQKVMDWEGKRVSKINEIWMLAGIENQSKNLWISRSKYRKIVKKTLPKMMFFSIAFFYRFSEGLGMLLGGGLEPLGLSLAVFWPLFLRLCAQEVLRGPKRRPRALLDSILDGSGGVLRGVWEDPRPPNCDKTRYVENHRFDIPCRRPQEAPKSSLGLDLGSILGGFGGVLGRVWEDFGAQN